MSGLFVKGIANVEGIARRFDLLFLFVDVVRPVVERSQVILDMVRS
ncbi:MAG: hypothetical protein ACHBN1_11815 [Heteroscytonema crispum UTEX LB 1556]